MGTTLPAPAAPRIRPGAERRSASQLVDELRIRVPWLVPGATLMVLALVVIGYAVLPTQSWLSHRGQISDLQAEIAELETANVALEERAAALHTVAAVERIARAELGLVLPGEEAYAILPPAPDPIRIPGVWPFTGLGAALVGG